MFFSGSSSSSSCGSCWSWVSGCGSFLDELWGVQNQLAALTASEYPVLATDWYEQVLPVRDYYTKRLPNLIDALPAGNVYHRLQVEVQQDVSHVRQMYLSTSIFNNAIIFRLCVVFSPYALNTATYTAYSYFGRKRIRLVFFCEYILEIRRNWILATGQQYCFGTMMDVLTPTPNLHRGRTTTNMMTMRGNNLTLHRHHHSSGRWTSHDASPLSSW